MTKNVKPKLKDFIPQQANTNKHSERGMRMLSQSIEKNGVIGAMTVAANGETFDGSATWETCIQTFGGDVEPIIIRSKGDRPIIHIREDIETAEDPKAKELGVAANRVAEVNLLYDVDIMIELGQDIDLSEILFYPEELDQLLGMNSRETEDEREVSSPDDFKEYGEDIETEHSCPKCGYKWSGGSNG